MKAQAIGSVHQALLSGILVQWLVDPATAPSADEILSGLRAIAEQIAARISRRSSAAPRPPRWRTPTGSSALLPPCSALGRPSGERERGPGPEPSAPPTTEQTFTGSLSVTTVATG